MEQLEEFGPMPQGVLLPERVCSGLNTSRPEVGTEANSGQVGKVGEVSEGSTGQR